MKSFGVRLGAGLVTIVFGAYAAALAQKDKQNGTTSWSAPAPSLGQPAAPIADDAGPSASQSFAGSGVVQAGGAESRLAQAAMSLGQSSASPSSVALVQHQEDIPAEASPSFSPPSFSPPPMGSPSFESAPSSLNAGSLDAEAAGPESMSMPLPDFDVEQPSTPEPAAPADDQPPPNVQQFAGGASDWMMPSSEQATGGEQAPAPEPVDSPKSLSMTFPEGDTFAAEPSPTPDYSQPDPANYPDPTASPANGMNPSNIGNGLRPGQPDANVLRSGPSTFAAPDGANGYADPVIADPVAIANQAAMANANAMANEAQYPPSVTPDYNLSAPPPMPEPIQAAEMMPPARSASLGNPAVAPSPSAYAPQTFATPQTMSPQSMSPPPVAAQIDSAAVLGAPGDRRLEGVQSPSVQIQKTGPAEVQVGKPAPFIIRVQNVGAAEALNVVVHERVPSGMRLVDASPTPVQQGDLLLWQLGALPAGDERTITMQLVPETEGELGSVGRVTFEAAASVRTMATRPELKIVQRSVEKVLIGQQLEIDLEVSNPGTGAATGVSLMEDVPEGLEHPKGRQLDNLLGTLAPGEVRNQVLRLKAVAPGMIRNTIRLVSEDGLTAEHSIDVEVIAPAIQVELTGPTRKFLEQQATYQLEIANTGTARATNLEIAVQLDRGFTFVSTDYEGQYDPSRHAVYWELAELPAGGKGSVPLKLLPVEEGERMLVVDARADSNISARSERAVTVEGFAELTFQILNPGGPVGLGAETSYEISVTNGGSKTDTNVRVQLKLPAGLELINADGDASTDGRGLVAFAPRSELAPGAEMKYRVRVRGTAPGTHLVKAIVVSDHAAVPVTKEESTLVYADQ